jgi:hypothetical protein
MISCQSNDMRLSEKLVRQMVGTTSCLIFLQQQEPTVSRKQTYCPFRCPVPCQSQQDTFRCLTSSLFIHTQLILTSLRDPHTAIGVFASLHPNITVLYTLRHPLLQYRPTGNGFSIYTLESTYNSCVCFRSSSHSPNLVYFLDQVLTAPLLCMF